MTLKHLRDLEKTGPCGLLLLAAVVDSASSVSFVPPGRQHAVVVDEQHMITTRSLHVIARINECWRLPFVPFLNQQRCMSTMGGAKLPIRAPYGTWRSPIDVEAIFKKTTSLAELIVDSAEKKVYHIEVR